jgi:hypothetical protein
MAATEISFTLEWITWMPIVIAAVSLVLTFRNMHRSKNRDSLADLERRIDRANKLASECETKLERCEHEKNELRNEKYVLMQRLTKLPCDD